MSNSVNSAISKASLNKLIKKVIHDIRSPLSSLIMLASSNNLPNFEKECIDLSIQRIKRIIDSADNILTNNIDNKAQEELIDICAIIEKILIEKRVEYLNKNIQFVYHEPANIQTILLLGSMHDFERMLSNILNNAVDACKDKVGIIKIETNIKNNFIYLTIEDNGIGIPKEILKQLKKGISLTYGKTNGHGIGMQQINDVIINLNGKLTIESKVGLGTKLSIRLQKIYTK